MERRRIRAKKSVFFSRDCHALYRSSRVWRRENASAAER